MKAIRLRETKSIKRTAESLTNIAQMEILLPHSFSTKHPGYQKSIQFLTILGNKLLSNLE